MTIKIGINGFGRMGRLSFRVLWENPQLEIIQINDPGGDAATLAHLVNFDSVHGRWQHQANHNEAQILVGDRTVKCTKNFLIKETDWSECDIVIEATGKMKTQAILQDYLDQGVKKVLVSAPVKEDGVLNIVLGVNHQLYQADKNHIITAASCTTNCLAPVVKVLHQNLTIRHGSITTIHSVTNTQNILDSPHKDLRRARACGMSLIPTTTGSASAITHIFPELTGKLNGHAVRVPLENASLTDCVFEVETETTVTEVNELFKQAAENELKDILGYEERPLVSIDYKTDPRSSIVDALSTMVVNKTQVKIYTWYDNEWGYANRIADLVKLLIDKGLD
jgi:glyceraldehyde 3-phosphate dehydrogenase